jgi:hypothetical protein
MFDYQNRRAIIVDGHNFIVTFTTVQDLAAVVVGAVDKNGEWPVIGGIRGNRVTVSQIIKIGEKVRGMLLYPHKNWTCLQQIIGRPSFGHRYGETRRS